MSNWRSKSSNKKFDNKQISKTTLNTIKTDNSTSLSVPKQRDTINSISTTIITENSNTTSQNNKTRQLFKNRKQTSAIKDANSSISREKQPMPNSNTLKTSLEWEQILDREFQSLDIDADGYVSKADMQSVLKNFSHIYNSNEIMSSIFEKLDRNRDQRISKEEFKLYKNILLDREKLFHRSTFEEKLDSVFILFDRNQDNYISPHEIRETMHNLGEHIDDNLIEEMMHTADTNHDGRISREEFKKLLIQLHSKE